MLRKISTKAVPNDEKPKKLQLKHNDNEYYLPHPNSRAVKPHGPESSFDKQKEKLQLKYPRKGSRTGPMRTYSTTNFKNDIHNVSKEFDAPNITKNNNAKKVETRKIRYNSNVETPKKALSKSSFKVQINSLKKDVGSKRLNLKIETQTPKKVQKINLRSMNFDTYYNNQCPNAESKTARGMRRPEQSQSQTMNNNQFGLVLNRCRKLIEDYQEQLESVRRQNKYLHQQNHRLRGLTHSESKKSN